jgi:hypothetical protein
MIDTRLLAHWQRERGARERARAALPASWRNDSRPRMRDVREAYVEAMLELKRPRRLSAITNDDR